MHSLLMRSALVAGVALIAPILPAATASAQADPEARCSQLVSYYSRYGSSRGEDTDGNRDFIRVGAELDCQNGRYEQGVNALETLMKGKNWNVPPLPRS
jgi:hypothetical protein